MKELVIEKTVKTPFVHFDPEKGELRLVGRSIPENPEEFFSQLFDWIDEYFIDPRESTTANLQLEYINSGSSKFILDLFQRLQKYSEMGRDCKVNWYYEEDDEAVLDLGKHYQTILKLPFHLIETY